MASDIPHHLTFAARTVKSPEFNKFRLASARAHKSQVFAVAWSCDGRRLGSVSDDKTVRIWPEKALDSRNPDGKQSLALAGHSARLNQLAWHPTDPHLLSTVARDQTVRLWDDRVPNATSVIPVSTECMNIVYHPSGTHLAVGQDAISFFDMRMLPAAAASGTPSPVQPLSKIPKSRQNLYEFKWAPEGDIFAVGQMNGCVKLLDWPTLQTVHEVEAHPSSCFVLDFTRDGEYMVTGGGDATVGIYSTDEWIGQRCISSIEGLVRSLSISHDSEYIAIGTDERPLSIASLHTGEVVHTFESEGKTNSLAWHPQKHMLAIASEDVSVGTKAGVSLEVRVWARGGGGR